MAYTLYRVLGNIKNDIAVLNILTRKDAHNKLKGFKTDNRSLSMVKSHFTMFVYLSPMKFYIYSSITSIKTEELQLL